MPSNSVSLVWSVPPEQLAQNIGTWLKRVLEAAYALATVFAARIESYAKANAVWTDRTGNARQGLTARSFRSATGFTILLFHAVSYGIWLEVANAGRFAIILRSLEAHYGPLMAALQRLVH